MKKMLLALLAIPLMLSAGEAEVKAANELLDSTQFEKTMENSLNAYVDMVKQMNPEFVNFEATIRNFFEKYISAKALRPEVAAMYAGLFTTNELQEIIAFYKTETGQKTLKMLPEILNRFMQLGQTRVMQHGEELEAMLKEAANK